MGFPGDSDDKEFACNAGEPGSIPGSERSPEEWKLPIPVFLPGESHGQRSLVGYIPKIWAQPSGHHFHLCDIKNSNTYKSRKTGIGQLLSCLF